MLFKSLHFSDDTYMYDDAARGALGRNNQGHWYDEPPYESDPDDFLMSGGPAATIQVCSFSPLKHQLDIRLPIYELNAKFDNINDLYNSM